MADILINLIIAAIVITVVIAVAAIAIKIFLFLVPVLAVVAGIALVVWFFGGCDPSNISTPQKQVTAIQKKSRGITTHIRDTFEQEIHEEVISLTRLKSGVNLAPLRPELDSAILVVISAYHEFMNDDDYTPVITSANDFEGHAQRSAHYSGAAVDFRIKDIGNLQKRKALAAQIADALGKRFTVLHEDIGSANEHLHIQLKKGSYDRNVVWRSP